eukprot:scaffold2102_cov161-Amphora_coffeaeformis.AAC.27
MVAINIGLMITSKKHVNNGMEEIGGYKYCSRRASRVGHGVSGFHGDVSVFRALDYRQFDFCTVQYTQ